MSVPLVKRHESDPGTASCKCGNVCNRATKRGACPCLARGSFCSKNCSCGRKLPCSNMPGRRGSKLSERLGMVMEVESDDSDGMDIEELVS